MACADNPALKAANSCSCFKYLQLISRYGNIAPLRETSGKVAPSNADAFCARSTRILSRVRLLSQTAFIEPRLSGRASMEMYEVQLCPHGRWDRQQSRIVAARDEQDAAYKVTGERLKKDGDRRKPSLRV